MTDEEKKEIQPLNSDSLLPTSKSKAMVQAPRKLRAIIELMALRMREATFSAGTHKSSSVLLMARFFLLTMKTSDALVELCFVVPL